MNSNSPTNQSANDRSVDPNVASALPKISKIVGGSQKAGDILSNLAGGNMEGLSKVIKFITEGYKLDNFSMRILLDKMRKENDFTDSDLLDFYLALDQTVEQGLLTNEMLDHLKENPDALNNKE